MKQVFFALLGVLMLSACAESVAPPVAVQALAPEKRASIRVSEVSAEASQGVMMTQFELDRVTQRIKAEITAQSPNAMVTANNPDAGQSVKMHVIFTQYDRGNSFARFMLAGLGQIHIDADVLLLDAGNGQVIGRYQVSKNFSFGGVYGGSTKIEDVEVGFAKSAAAIITGQKS
jgi:hypothetical protein